MASIFISHASLDRSFALRLAGSLKELGHTIWIDAQEITVGESIVQRVEEGVERADYLVVVLSRHASQSAWLQKEWQAKFWSEVVGRQNLILPVLLEDCEIPLFLRPKRYADFRANYAVGLAQLTIALHEARTAQLHCTDHRLPAATTLERAPISHALVASQDSVCYHDDTMDILGRLAEVNVELQLPYIGKIGGVWQPDEREQDAAWEMYVELVTRISVTELQPGQGLLRESLSSLYSIFTTTRQILREHGPSVARPKGDGELSFGYIAISVLNFALRPVLAKWHPLLLDYEHRREALVSPLQHEEAWERATQLRQVLNQVRGVLIDYAGLLAQICRVPATLPV
ncbi:MAG: toll/interleukin-1 receptor domain-containing protein [Chloroflexota bacterium]|nr:toll/interleukin-1 receptor domain-containing protein [Chloroflexota bacterium]